MQKHCFQSKELLYRWRSNNCPWGEFRGITDNEDVIYVTCEVSIIILLQIECNKCGCRNGNIRCTRRPCRSSFINDSCTSCSEETYAQVCGLNGVTYPSRCNAVYCSGQIPFTLRAGACSKRVSQPTSRYASTVLYLTTLINQFTTMPTLYQP